MPTPSDPALYASIKKQVQATMSPSAYASGQMVRRYKKAYAKKHPTGSPYVGPKPTGGLSRWYREDWRTATGSKTYEKPGDIFRPTKRITSKTPVTMQELTPTQKKKAARTKASGKRIKSYK